MVTFRFVELCSGLKVILFLSYEGVALMDVY